MTRTGQLALRDNANWPGLRGEPPGSPAGTVFVWVTQVG